MNEIPTWVIEYNNQNHQSSAGRAIKILMNQLQKEKELRKELVGYVIAYKGLASLTSDEDIFIQSLIQKSKDL